MRVRFVLSQVFKGLANNKAMAVAVILVSFVSLLFVGGGGLLQMQISLMEKQWYDKIEVAIFMCTEGEETKTCAREATAEEVEAVGIALRSPEMKPFIKEVTFESREEAFENFQEQFGDSAIGSRTTSDMLPESYRVRLVDPEQFRIIKEEFTSKPGVSIVHDQREVVEPLLIGLNRATILSWGLAAVMSLAAVLLIATTIQLSAMSREKETSIMRLVGASELFIQLPFMIEGAVAALIGAAGAVGGLFLGVHYIINGWLNPAFQWTSFVGYHEVLLIAPLLVLAAIALALLSSTISLARYTKV